MNPGQLVGTWRLHRDIEDRRGQNLTATGSATFTWEADGRLRWHESGTMHHVGADLPFHRTMFLVPPQGPTAGPAQTWHVTFEDGRFFHPWPAAAPAAAAAGAGAQGAARAQAANASSGSEVVHVCAPDLYQGEFLELAGQHAWSLRWRVTGPRKDYVMTTSYTRP